MYEYRKHKIYEKKNKKKQKKTKQINDSDSI